MSLRLGKKAKSNTPSTLRRVAPEKTKTLEDSLELFLTAKLAAKAGSFATSKASKATEQNTINHVSITNSYI